jgi:hypothetical protein
VLAALGPSEAKRVMQEFALAEQSKKAEPVKRATVAKQSRIASFKSEQQQQQKAPTKKNTVVSAVKQQQAVKYVTVDADEIDPEFFAALGEFGESYKAEVEEATKRRKTDSTKKGFIPKQQTNLQQQQQTNQQQREQKLEASNDAAEVAEDSVYNARYVKWRHYFLKLLNGFDLEVY